MAEAKIADDGAGAVAQAITNFRDKKAQPACGPPALNSAGCFVRFRNLFSAPITLAKLLVVTCCKVANTLAAADGKGYVISALAGIGETDFPPNHIGSSDLQRLRQRPPCDDRARPGALQHFKRGGGVT